MPLTRRYRGRPSAAQRAGGRSRRSERRRQERRRGSGLSISVNLAPMIDVSFLLLIFFLVTTTFERAEGLIASRFPRDTGAPAVTLPISPIVVRLEQTGPAAHEFAIQIDGFATEPMSLNALPELLRKIQERPGFDKQTPVVIVAEEGVQWDHVVGAWNAALVAGHERIAFGEP